MDISKGQPCQIVLIIVYVIFIEYWQPFTLTNLCNESYAISCHL